MYVAKKYDNKCLLLENTYILQVFLAHVLVHFAAVNLEDSDMSNLDAVPVYG